MKRAKKYLYLILLFYPLEALPQSHIIVSSSIGDGAVIYNTKTGPELAPLYLDIGVSWLPFYKGDGAIGVRVGAEFRLPNSWDSLDFDQFQLNFELGLKFLYRKMIDYSLGAILTSSFIFTPYTASGAGIKLFYVYYIRGGLGILFELNGYWHYGVDSVITLGYALGLIIDYEYW